MGSGRERDRSSSWASELAGASGFCSGRQSLKVLPVKTEGVGRDHEGRRERGRA